MKHPKAEIREKVAELLRSDGRLKSILGGLRVTESTIYTAEADDVLSIYVMTPSEIVHDHNIASTVYQTDISLVLGVAFVFQEDNPSLVDDIELRIQELMLIDLERLSFVRGWMMNLSECDYKYTENNAIVGNIKMMFTFSVSRCFDGDASNLAQVENKSQPLAVGV